MRRLSYGLRLSLLAVALLGVLAVGTRQTPYMQLNQQLISRLGAHESNTEQFVCWNAPALPMKPALSLNHGKYPFEVSGLNGLSRKAGVFQVEDLSGWPRQPIKWGEVFQRPVTSTHDCTRYLVMFLVSLIPAIDGKELVAGLVKAFELLGACSALIIRKAVEAIDPYREDTQRLPSQQASHQGRAGTAHDYLAWFQ